MNYVILMTRTTSEGFYSTGQFFVSFHEATRLTLKQAMAVRSELKSFDKTEATILAIIE